MSSENTPLSRDELILNILELVCMNKPHPVNIPLIQRDLFSDLSIDDIIGLFKEMNGIPGVTVMLNGSRSFVRYQISLEHYVNDKRKMNKKEKLHRIVEFLSSESKTLNQDCFDSEEISVAFSQKLNIYEVNALCRIIMENGDLKDCTTGDEARKDMIAVMVIPQTHEAFYARKYLEDDTIIFPQVNKNIVNINENKGNVSSGDIYGELRQEVKSKKKISRFKDLPRWAQILAYFILPIILAILTIIFN